ncbi:unnamed protein product [Parajaminaea phylloscopi]
MSAQVTGDLEKGGTATAPTMSRSSSSATSHSTEAKSLGAPPHAPAPSDPDIQTSETLPLRQFYPIYVGLLLGVFIISLDNTVVATAQVPIVRDLGGADLVSWLPTSFLIGQGAFALFWGQVLGSFPSKYVFLLNVGLFELGSLVSAVAPNMGAVLAGRAISGAGAAGMMSGAVQLLIEFTTLRQRAVYVGMLAAVFSISLISGPLIGGALSAVSWRWVFWINLPIGGITALTSLVLMPVRPPLGSSKTKRRPLLDRLRSLDIVGSALLTLGMCALVIPVAEAHATGWGSYKVWLPIAFSPVFFGAFYAWIWYLGPQKAVLPRDLLHNSTLIGSVGISFLVFWNGITYMYLLPYTFAVVRGHSATQSGIDILAMMITLALTSIFGGVLSRKTNHYWPQMVIAPLFGAVGGGLSFLISRNMTLGLHIGSQILLGLGMGMVIQGPMLVIQANIEPKVISKATAFLIFFQRFGGGLGESVANAILAAQLPGAIRRFLPAGVDAASYEHLDPTVFYGMPGGPVRDSLLDAVTWVIDRVLLMGVPAFVLVSVLMLTMVDITNLKTREVTPKSVLWGRGRGRGRDEGETAHAHEGETAHAHEGAGEAV